MKLPQEALDLIKTSEGLVLKAYADPKTKAEPYTIGYGTTVYPNGVKVKLGEVCTKQQAEEWFLHDVQAFSGKVMKQLPVNLTDNQFGALTSFCYNLGMGNWNKSTLKKKVLANPKDLTIRDEFMKWISKGTPVERGLRIRRSKEADLYFK